ncbi:toll/interleukin-1 receptor domain-containing protein [Psychrobacter sp. DAB_AL62B]|uniref:toll/interleukin-1 receptor domain-containing protein n=1 Tax=Psychrobacter sp. DAB_AL62B TaxID=1028420 RepID=UPI002380DB79|nr:toll/interleukin-1 receptor domain-containing protein [Psychrobacter sp. DAB_AL62B]MDE4455994.1 TIR domain-containing protein [Psychrobacter sp. DAB_AL62B]
MNLIPKCFISYSHDDEAHKEWVLKLATRLVNNGVDVILDQWDMRLGGDLPFFMERGLTEVDRVICVCTETYVSKANMSSGGVGYEKMILTSGLMKNINSEKIIPLIKNNIAIEVTPVFLQTKNYLDFRNETDYEKKYIELIKEIHGESIKARPALGNNPFEISESQIASSIEISKSQHCNPNFRGVVEFDYDKNNGHYIIGAGNMQFELKFSSASNGSIHVYKNPANIEGLALAYGVSCFSDINDALAFDYTSDSITPKTGEFVVLVNRSGFFATIKFGNIKARSHGAEKSSVSFKYKINQNKETGFE